MTYTAADMIDPDDRELRCTYCGCASLHVELRHHRAGAEVAGFWCDNERCGAEWERDRTVRRPGDTFTEVPS